LDDFEKVLKRGFLDEAEQSIADVEKSFLALETDPLNFEHINQIFRLAHNLKGASKALGFEQFGQLTHQFESFVLKIKNKDLEPNSAVIWMSLKTTAMMKQMILGLRNNLDVLSSEKVAKENQVVSAGLRLATVKTTFQKMQRLARNTAQILNKDVKLTLIGEETELDISLLKNLNDPLIHIIRNSVDHGIESTQSRITNGKPAHGNIILKAFHHLGRVVLEVIDDGAGLDTKKIKNKAIQQDLLNEKDALSDLEIFKIIFAPGFSTKGEVTEISGRGIGMDVVKTNIEKIGGEIQIESFLGKGTTIRIILPLVTVRADELIVAYKKEKHKFTLSHIHETKGY
jgi:chemotaxis protein histidine kinase CheA